MLSSASAAGGVTPDGEVRLEMERRMPALVRASIRRPRRALGLLLLVTALAAPGLARLELRTDGHALVPPDAPVVRSDAEVRRRFGLRDPLLVVVDSAHPDGIYNPESLARVRRLTEALAALPEIGAEQVMSLATERRPKLVPGTWTFQAFLDPLPTTAEELAELRADVEAAGILEGTLVSAGGEAAAILVGVPAALGPDGEGEPPRLHDRAALCERVRDLAAAHAGGTDRVRVVGAPLAEALLGKHLLEDLGRLLPLTLGIIALILGAACRRLWGVLLGFGEVAACLVFTFGVMGWLGVPVFLTTAVLPVVLVTVALADEVHLLWHYQVRRPEQEPVASSAERARRTLEEMARPVVLTSLTTAAGFLSFLAAPIPAVRAFGAFAALGVLFAMVWSLTVMPAAFVLLGPERLGRRGRPGSGSGRPRRRRAPGPLRPRLALVGLGAVTVLLGAGIPRLEVQDSWIDGFGRGSRFRRDTARVNRLFAGTHVLLVRLTFTPPEATVPRVRHASGPLLAPERLAAIGRFERFLRERGEVGGVLGVHAHLTAVAYLWGGRREALREIPDDPERVHLLLARFGSSRGEKRRREVIDDAWRSTLVTVLLRDANYRDTARLMEAARSWGREHLAPLGAELDFAGDVAVSQAMIPAIVRTQVISLALAFVFALVFVAAVHRSWAVGLAAVAPAVGAVVWIFGLMGWWKVPLGVATSMFCAITLGVGVDYGVHFLDRCRRAKGSGAERASLALREAGPAILADALAVGLGFGVLAASQVPANRKLGLLVAAALAVSCLLTLVGLSAWEARRG